MWQFNYKEKPIWLCKLEEITKEEYTSSYKSLTNVWNDYLIVKHFSIKGQLELKVVFFFCRREIHLICLTLTIWKTLSSITEGLHYRWLQIKLLRLIERTQWIIFKYLQKFLCTRISRRGEYCYEPMIDERNLATTCDKYGKNTVVIVSMFCTY